MSSLSLVSRVISRDIRQKQCENLKGLKTLCHLCVLVPACLHSLHQQQRPGSIPASVRHLAGTDQTVRQTPLMLFVFDSLAVREFLCLDDPPGPFDSLEESRVSMYTC